MCWEVALQIRYRSSGEATLHHAIQNLASHSTKLGRHEHFCFGSHPHLRTQKFQQHFHPPGIIKPMKPTNHFSKRTGQQPHPLPNFEVRGEVYDAGTVLQGHQSRDNTVWNDRGHVPRHHQGAYAGSSIDGAPAIAIEVKLNKEIAGKQGRRDRAKLPSVLRRFEPTRQKG